MVQSVPITVSKESHKETLLQTFTLLPYKFKQHLTITSSTINKLQLHYPYESNKGSESAIEERIYLCERAN
jgi:hypothetical protein